MSAQSKLTRLLRLALPVALVVAVASGATIAVAAKSKPPTITRHANVRAEATSPAGARVTYRPARVRRATSVVYSKRSGTMFRLGRTVVRITARNRAGVARSTFAVFVVDTTPPTFAPPQDVSTRATGAAGATVQYGPITATDRVDTNVSVTCSPASGSVFAVGTTQVSCTARDDAGNRATAAFRVVVRANNPPAFPNPMSVQATTSFQYNSFGQLTGATTTIAVSPATDADGDALTYAWTATNGSISGTGVSATWIRALQGGQPARGSVIVTASDGVGGSDTFTIEFR